MKKLIRAIALSMGILSALTSAVPAMAAETLAVEQVQLSPPDIDFYVYTDSKKHDLSDISEKDITAKVGDKALKVGKVTSQKNENKGVFYAFLLDISGSIPQDSLNAAISSIQQIAKGMGKKDRLCVITFGDNVKVISDGTKKPADTLKALRGLQAKDQTTQFYSAMDRLIQVTGKQAKGRRTVAVVVSDGVDDTNAGMSEAQLTTTLKNSGIAVYAMQVGKVTKEQTSHLRKFIRVSGGEVYRFEAKSATKTIKSLITQLSDVITIHLKGDDSIKVDSNTKVELMVKGFAPVRWTIDRNAWIRAQRTKARKAAKKDTVDRQALAKQEAESTIAANNAADQRIVRQRRLIMLALAAVVVIAVIVVVILLIFRQRNIRKKILSENGFDGNAAIDFDKAIKQKRKMK